LMKGLPLPTCKPQLQKKNYPIVHYRHSR
jgi:hypothetical protein